MSDQADIGAGLQLSQRPVHLGLGASSVVQPSFDGALEWYAAYGERHAGDGAEGRLVAMYTFDTSWDSWEMHPLGSEVVVCTAGEIVLTQETTNGSVSRIRLRAGEYAINDPGVWHTADVAETATVLFITAGVGTQHRPRN